MVGEGAGSEDAFTQQAEAVFSPLFYCENFQTHKKVKRRAEQTPNAHRQGSIVVTILLYLL